MTRTLYQLADNELYELREKAHRLLSELYLTYENWQAYAQHVEEQRNAWKRRTPEYRELDMKQRQAWHYVVSIETRIAAQRQFCNELDTEFAHRNPPFWSRQDLEDMDHWRSRS